MFNYLLIVAIGLTVAWWIEMDALRDGRWAYGDQMPLLFSVGLTSLMQLPLLSLVSYEAMRRFSRAANLTSFTGVR